MICNPPSYTLAEITIDSKKYNYRIVVVGAVGMWSTRSVVQASVDPVGNPEGVIHKSTDAPYPQPRT